MRATDKAAAMIELLKERLVYHRDEIQVIRTQILAAQQAREELRTDGVLSDRAFDEHCSIYERLIWPLDQKLRLHEACVSELMRFSNILTQE